MDLRFYLENNENEKPLDTIPPCGGLSAIFRRIGCVGDSLSSGEFETRDPKGTPGFHDLYDFSWGQFIARDTGATVFNFSKGGMTAHDFTEFFSHEVGFEDKAKRCSAYIVALGSNDLFMEKREMGCENDINIDEPEKNPETFAGYYGRILSKIKKMQPDAFIFLMSMPRHGSDLDKTRGEMADLLDRIAEKIDRTYHLNFYKYAPVYDGEFQKRYFLHGHMNPAGYRLSALMTESYIDYVIRHDPEAFKEVGFIGTDILEKIKN